jgi:hypothetical protein
MRYWAEFVFFFLEWAERGTARVPENFKKPFATNFIFKLQRRVREIEPRCVLISPYQSEPAFTCQTCL